MSVSSLVGFLTFCNQTNIGISPVLDDISFWNFFGDIAGMFVPYFQIISNFLYICQSVSWLTSLLKLNKSRDISSSGWYIFLKFFGDIPGMLVHYFLIFLNSAGWLTSLLKLDKYRDVSRSGWDIFLIFFRYSWDVSTLATNDSEFFVCLSVCLFAYFLTKIRQGDISISGWDIFLKLFWQIFWMFCTLVPNYSEFFVCLSVC